jgi:hypothetical protein
MSTTQQLESKVETLLNIPSQQPNPNNPQWNWNNFQPYADQNMFAEHNGFNQSLLQVQGGNLLIMVLGAILSSTIAGLMNRFLPLGSFSGVVGALILRHFFKGGKGKDFANGVLIGAVSSLVAPMVSGLTSGLGGLFGEDRRRAPTVPSLSGNGRMIMQ